MAAFRASLLSDFQSAIHSGSASKSLSSAAVSSIPSPVSQSSSATRPPFSFTFPPSLNLTTPQTINTSPSTIPPFLLRRDSWRNRGILGSVLTFPHFANSVLDHMRAEIDKTLSSDVIKLPLMAQIDSIFATLSHLQPLVRADPSNLSWAVALIDDAFSPCQRAVEALTFSLHNAHHYAHSFAPEYYKVLEGHSGNFTPAETRTKRRAVQEWVPLKRLSSKQDFRKRVFHSKDPPRTPSSARNSPGSNSSCGSLFPDTPSHP